MRLTAIAITLALALPAVQPRPAAAGEARPDFSVDPGSLPAPPQILTRAERDQQAMVAAATGAVAGIVVADVLTGGLLLAPLGLPAFATLMGGGAAAVPAPTYTVVQQVLAGVASLTAALGGGYVGMRVAGPPMMQ